MSREFRCEREIALPATPEQAWEAVSTTEGNAAWLFPVPAAEPGAPGVTWEPPHHLCVRQEQGEWFNELDFHFEAAGDGTTILRYVHSGILVEDWDTQYDAVQQHTDFYLHTLAEYLGHFQGRSATYVGDVPAGVVGPPGSATPDGFERLLRALGLPERSVEGDEVSLRPDGLETIDGVVDYRRGPFLGIRTADALYCFFGRNAFGQPVGMSIHHFGDGVDAAALQRAWARWLEAELG